MKTGIFTEDGWEAKVEILADQSNDKEERYTLKVIETLHEPYFVNTPPNGYVFDVFAKQGYKAMVGWDLREEG